MCSNMPTPMEKPEAVPVASSPRETLQDIPDKDAPTPSASTSLGVFQAVWVRDDSGREEEEGALSSSDQDDVDFRAADSGSDEEEEDEFTHRFNVASEGEVESEGEADEGPSNFCWSDDFNGFTGVEERYEQQSGLRIGETSPSGIFKTIWNLQVMHMIVARTNKYAWEMIASACETEDGITAGSRLNDWKETTVDEIFRFFAIMIYMSFCGRDTLEEYWDEGVMGMPLFRKLMSKNRFILLLRFLHFVDNDELTDSVHGDERKILKIAPIVEHCNRRFAEIYVPRRALTIYESLLLWKGRTSVIERIMTKAPRLGIKSYELCETQSGYAVQFMIYAGENQDSGQAINGFSNATSKVVLKVVDGYLGKGHCLYLDSFYNSVGLARFLKKNRTDVVGTWNRRRVDTPANIKGINDRQMPWGDIIAEHCGDVTVLAWKDVRLVSMISTFHKNDSARGHVAGIDCDKPVVAHDFNKYMKGGDLVEDKLTMYLLEQKQGLKWYVKVFRRLLNCSIHNSFIVYRCQDTMMSHSEFRMALANALAVESVDSYKARPTPNPSSLTSRYTGNHFPTYVLENPNRANKRAHKYKRRRCVNCMSKKIRVESRYRCSDCNVFLCVGQCWMDYHTPPSEW